MLAQRRLRIECSRWDRLQIGLLGVGLTGCLPRLRPPLSHPADPRGMSWLRLREAELQRLDPHVRVGLLDPLR